jgi:hypothetical protein
MTQYTCEHSGITFETKEEYKKGWVCPKCDNVMSPTSPMCFNCNSNNKTIKNLYNE